MMTIYTVAASVERDTHDGWTGLRVIPLFYLDSDVQGITSTEHATSIARRMLTDAAGPEATVHVQAYATGYELVLR